jgi:hypothetical protein
MRQEPCLSLALCALFTNWKEENMDNRQINSPASVFFREQGFLPANADSYSLFREYENCSTLQEMSATIIAAWSFAYNGLYKKIMGWLCSVYFYEGKPVYFALHRPGEEAAEQPCPLQKIIDELFVLCNKAGLPFLQVKFIEERSLEKFQVIKGYEIATEYFEDDSEYAYRIPSLLELSGTVNFYKRKRLKKCFNDPRILLRPMTRENVRLCAEIENEWCKHQDCSSCGSFSGCEKEAMEIMTDIFDDKVYTGLVMYLDEKPDGYIICEKRNAELSYLYFGKTNTHDYFVYLIYVMARDHLSDVQYMNMNEDMGHAGLRMFKRHVSAHELWKKYICTYTKRSGI